MNWINTTENLGITIISFSAGVLLGWYVTASITDKIIESNQGIIISAIQKPSTAINNDYDIKNKKGTLDLKPNNYIMNQDSLDNLNKESGWWIFKGRNNDKK